MDLQLHEHDVDGVVVLSLQGEVDLATLPQLRDGLLRASGRRPGGTLVVDLDAVGALDDSGLGVLAGTAGRLRLRGGDLVLVCSNARLRTLMATTRLDRAFDVHD